MKKFVLLAERRSGTSLLIDCLVNHGDIQCAKRVFAIDRHVSDPDENNHSSDFYLYRTANIKNRIKFYFRKESLINDFMKNKVFSTSDLSVVGFRLIYDKADQYPEVIDWCKKNDISIIHLVRNNILKTYVSMVTARIHKMHHPRKGDKVKHAKIELDTNDLLDVLDKRSQNTDYKRKLFNGLPYLEVSYENFVENRAEESKNILEFLGLPSTVSLGSDLVKINPSGLSDVLNNYDEVSALLRGTSHEKYLD